MTETACPAVASAACTNFSDALSFLDLDGVSDFVTVSAPEFWFCRGFCLLAEDLRALAYFCSLTVASVMRRDAFQRGVSEC